ncbi:pyridoxal phosphate-dependent aminotransferase [Amphritea sp. 2_MG-2023]|uniref:pyridoxal phosphate-dependent aminotransferase n=1 Tax=Amphritea TaxID=515417 RepID=UPI001C06CC6F|nr:MULTISPECIES: pyridoxal phosphate-dependent aminotransferase [Amphritea]MBU2966863.1 pyridoxal phosphate-dependent aminotransferase [Amphritea atlantica]MDO6420079.1 pyridoxal phosphate-dependent aminotransferase [Amphritea sp. 2_MG-2023]
MNNWSDRVADIESFKVMDLLKRAKELETQGHDVVHMCAGEPDFATPAPIAEAGIAAIQDGHTQYTPAAGIPALREAIAGFYQYRYGLDIPAERIIVTAGASGALLMVFATLANPGQTFMMADPGYPCNPRFLRLLEARGQLVPVEAADNYQLTPALIEQHWQENTAGVLLASPSNPTGSVVPREQLELIAQTVKGKGGHLVVDELYHGLTYGFDATSVLSVDQDAFVLNSFSKYFGMTGWRLGWTVVPESAAPDIERLAQNLFISPPTIAQHAALAAFRPETLEILEQRREAFKERRDLLVDGLRALGFGIPLMPEGAFYVYADASRFTDNTFDFCWDLLEQDKVAVTPGVDFGEYQANRYIRFSYTTSVTQIEKALARLRLRLS